MAAGRTRRPLVLGMMEEPIRQPPTGLGPAPVVWVAEQPTHASGSRKAGMDHAHLQADIS